MYRKAVISVVALICTVALSAFPGEREGRNNDFLRERRGLTINHRNFFTNTSNDGRTPLLEESIIQVLDPENSENWVNETRITYIYSGEDILNGWTYSSFLPDGGWSEPYKKATVVRLANGLISSLTYSVYDDENNLWLDEIRYTQEYTDRDYVEYLSLEHYDMSGDEWIKESYMEFEYSYGGILEKLIIANKIHNEPDYELEQVRFKYFDEWPNKKLFKIYYADDMDNFWANYYYRRSISYHESDTSNYEDFQNYLNNLSLYLDEDANWTMGGNLSGFGYANVASIIDYERITPDRWEMRFRYNCRYDENNNLSFFSSDEYYPPTANSDHIWLGEKRYSLVYNQQGLVNQISREKNEPFNALKEIRFAYNDYRKKQGSYDGYYVETALGDAGIKPEVRRQWTFEVIGNPPTQYIASSTTEHPHNEGHQVIYDIPSRKFWGHMFDILPYWLDKELMWIDDIKMLFNYRGITSAEDNSIPLTSIALTNYPNPFNPETTIAFNLPSTQEILLNIYDARGRLVKVLAEGVFDTGKHRVVWNGSDNKGNTLPSGLYFYRLETKEQTLTGKMLLLK